MRRKATRYLFLYVQKAPEEAQKRADKLIDRENKLAAKSLAKKEMTKESL
jgi:hypothetical protein